MRVLIGLVLAPLAPGLLMLALSLLGNAGKGLWALKLIAMFAYPAMIVLGLPIHLLFQRIGWTSVWPYSIAGAFVGAVVTHFVFPTLNAGQASASSIAIAAISAVFGAIAAATFWLVVRPNNQRAGDS
ncbi:hypothetical protein FZ025_00655 [Xanthomonas hyacinthi]|uniref:Uncharacterized protein n=1 Tax=Xanthomonas hyacinthi TaxID=56455 RepID=A0A2S7ENC7_9XANT|nr:hypothetical protein [Xanthomonas hyacinthi]KLD73918.1 hypothetical protein Y886_35385 [Xanthomonas hyacinthi DSM 19077]PPU92842.1 hypothetical protein XhyaCFBP1156_20940 [Xanthomonas hyacinthi]QGY75252.1 hypothetical protein FZ025_00655 [Xanthomonas hyacinthi]